MRRSIFGASIAVLALSGLALGPASAGAPDLPLTVDPTSGPPGSIVTVSGECSHQSQVTEYGIGVQAFGQAYETFAENPTGNGGPWSIEITVPDDAPLGPAAITAECLFLYGPDLLPDGGRSYKPASFEVTAPEPEPEIDPETETPPIEVEGEAEAATPVEAAPTFTG